MNIWLITEALSLVTLVALHVTSAPDMGSVLQKLAGEFDSGTTQVLSAVNKAAIDITRAAYVTILLIGILLYFTHLQRRLGRDMITGAIVLALISEFILPTVLRI
jgi:hypothetical protein